MFECTCELCGSSERVRMYDGFEVCPNCVPLDPEGFEIEVEEDDVWSAIEIPSGLLGLVEEADEAEAEAGC